MRPILLALGAALLVALTAAPAAGAKTKNCPNTTIENYLVREFHASSVSCKAALTAARRIIAGGGPAKPYVCTNWAINFGASPPLRFRLRCHLVKDKSHRFDLLYWAR